MKTEAVVLKLTGNALFDVGFRIPGDTDWQAVYEAAIVDIFRQISMKRNTMQR